MRLTCPNCDAQYEVPDEVVPTSGRDVQCSNCGQTWFQHHPDHMPEDDAEDMDDLVGTDDGSDPDEEVAPPPPPTPPGAPAAAQRQLDPAVADILRQEAEAEHEARRKRQQADQDPLESQPDLGLDEGGSLGVEDDYDEVDADDDDTESADDSDYRASQARSRMARMRGEPAPEGVMGAAAATSRRELLPDIEEINSTLRSDSDRAESAAHLAEEEEDARQSRRGGFRRGFLLMILLFVALTLIYVFAPQLARAVPQLDPFLSGFVTWVDGLRLWLDGQLEMIGGWLADKAAQSSN
jgi:predicted Zn finger-like uncharacterized protein